MTKSGSLSTVVGDEKLTSREDRIGPLFMYVQCDEDTFLKVDKVSKTEAQTFDVFNQLVSRFTVLRLNSLFLVHFGCIACV